MAVDEEEEIEKPKGKGKLVIKILLFGVLPVMTAVLLVLGTLFIAGVFPGGGEAQTTSVEEGESLRPAATSLSTGSTCSSIELKP